MIQRKLEKKREERGKERKTAFILGNSNQNCIVVPNFTELATSENLALEIHKYSEIY